jgi:hypothetical protein
MTLRRFEALLAGASVILSSSAGAQVTRESWFPGSSSISEPEVIPPAFRGTWAPTAAACRDEDGVDRYTVVAEGLDTYESGGRLERVTQAGQDRSIRLRIAYEGEGEFTDAVETWTLSESGDRLTVADGERRDPVTYLRCR